MFQSNIISSWVLKYIQRSSIEFFFVSDVRTSKLQTTESFELSSRFQKTGRSAVFRVRSDEHGDGIRFWFYSFSPNYGFFYVRSNGRRIRHNNVYNWTKKRTFLPVLGTRATVKRYDFIGKMRVRGGQWQNTYNVALVDIIPKHFPNDTPAVYQL